MLHFALWGTSRRFGISTVGLEAVWRQPAVRDELRELLGVLDERSEHAFPAVVAGPRDPAHDTRAVQPRRDPRRATALGTPDRRRRYARASIRGPQAPTDLFFVTLNKSERDYSPTTMYRDYAISRELFHWESQATRRRTRRASAATSSTPSRGHTIMLFVRDRKRAPEGGTPPSLPGPARYVESSRRPAGVVHVAVGDADAGGVVRGRASVAAA